MKKKRIITNDKIYKVQRIQTFLGIPLYWKTDGYWNKTYNQPVWTKMTFDSLEEAQEWMMTTKYKTEIKERWKVVK